MPPHPDPELSRCIAVFKEDYRALKEKRASASLPKTTPPDSPRKDDVQP